MRRAAIDRAVQEELAVISLREIREVAGKTQAQVASVMAKAQAEISQIEKRDDLKLSTLRKYIKAVGGDLEVWAVLGDKRISIASSWTSRVPGV